MRRIWMLAVLAIGGVACGGGTKGGTTTTTTTGQVTAKQGPGPAGGGPACAEMATKVIGTIAAGRSEKFQREAPRMAEIVRERCEKDAWTAESRRCMTDAASRDDAQRCFKQLTPAQQQAMDDAEAEMRRTSREREEADEGADEGAAAPRSAAPPPPPALAPPSPGSPAKADAKKKAAPAGKGGKVNGDPCMGGE